METGGRSAEPLEICSTINISYTPLPSPTKNRILRKTNEQGLKTQGEGRAIPLSDPLPPYPGKAVYVGSENGLGIGEGVPSLIGGGEWFPPHPPRGGGLGPKVSFNVTTAGGGHPVGASSPRQERSRGRWLTVRGEHQGRSVPCMPRYDNAYYQTMRPGLGGRRRGTRRPGALVVFHQVRRPAVSASPGGPSAGHGV